MEKNLNDKTWKPLPAFGKDATLHIETTNSSIDSVSLVDNGNKTVPYITRTDTNNGLANFVSDKNYDFGSDDGNCITVGLDTQTAFYQPHKFVTGQNIQIITSKNLDKDTALFLVTILHHQMTAKFNWGGNGATLGRMKRLVTMLPVTNSGKPDYDYMRQYTKQNREQMLSKYRDFAERRIAELGKYIEIPALNDKEWKPISLAQYFKFKRGQESNMADLLEGRIPLVSAKSVNNGVKSFVNTSRDTVNGNCITLNNDGDGGAGLAYYQPMDMALDTHVTALIPEQSISRYALLFISQCISGLHGFFGHGLSISTARAKRIRVMLPVTDSGKPDYEYMEQYIKNLLLKKYRQYLAYLKASVE